MTVPATPEPVNCGAITASCICGLTSDHEGPHHCMAPTITGEPCGGMWNSDPFEIVRLPDIGPLTDMIYGGLF